MQHLDWFAGILSRLALFSGIALFLYGCQDASERGTGPKPEAPAGAPPEQVSDAPIKLAYVCGNQFLITNAYDFAVEVTYRVGGSEEVGTKVLAPAPDQDPAFSEALIETRNRGPVELYVRGEKIESRANGSIPCTPTTPAPSFLTTGNELAGEWSAAFPWPIVGLHSILLPNGKVLSWGHDGEPQIWDPTTGVFTTVPGPAELFCAGHSLLPDGRVLVTGGHISDDHGLPNVTTFKAITQAWVSQAPMQRGRWYPTNVTTHRGEVVILAGRDEAGVTVSVPEVWTTGGWRVLSTASRSFPYYPRAFLAPNGKVFYAGEQQTTRYLSAFGTGSWSTVGLRLYGTRDYGSAVMYDVGKILYVGGGRTTNTAEIIDLTQAAPKWQWTGSMAYPRRHHNATVLPTGEVLVTGGTSGTTFNDVTQAVHAAELWNPATGMWTTLASNTVKRAYHSTSILLPDGRVLHSGSGDAAGAPDELNAELFSPPYLFKGPRPTITSAPVSALYGTSFTVQTPDAASIAKVSLIRLGAVTHAFDQNQRFQTLSFSPGAGGLTISAPTGGMRAPPGHYMLFILNADGVPSVARIIQIK